MKKETYAMYGDILREELLLAMGCTEPVAVAYAGAIARSVLDKPQSIRKCELYVSGNIIKNVKSVIVPNTDGMKGLETAVILGVIAGDETAGLQVISNVTALQREKRRHLARCRPLKTLRSPGYSRQALQFVSSPNSRLCSSPSSASRAWSRRLFMPERN